MSQQRAVRKNIRHDKGAICSTSGCPDEAVILDKCKPCYNWNYRWSREPMAHRHAYKQKIARIAARQEELDGAARLRLVRPIVRVERSAHSRRRKQS